MYDADGDVTRITDPNGNITTKTYDALNRPLTSTSVGATTESTSWTYDNPASSAFGIGRLWTMTDPTGNFTYSYEPRGKLAKKTQSVATSLYSTPFTSSYSYDADGDLATYTMPSGRALTYAYDYAHRPVLVSGIYNGVAQTYVSNALYSPLRATRTAQLRERRRSGLDV